jgi:sugar phosphate isomerase/epimerase
MSAKKMIISVCRQNHRRDNWKVDLQGESFMTFVRELSREIAGFGVELESTYNDAVTISVNSYADLLNVVRITSPADGFTNKCIGHIIGQSQNLDFFEDVKRAVNRVAFAPETIQPDESNRKVCHNCGCGC